MLQHLAAGIPRRARGLSSWGNPGAGGLLGGAGAPAGFGEGSRHEAGIEQCQQQKQAQQGLQCQSRGRCGEEGVSEPGSAAMGSGVKVSTDRRSRGRRRGSGGEGLFGSIKQPQWDLIGDGDSEDIGGGDRMDAEENDDAGIVSSRHQQAPLSATAAVGEDVHKQQEWQHSAGHAICTELDLQQTGVAAAAGNGSHAGHWFPPGGSANGLQAPHRQQQQQQHMGMQQDWQLQAPYLPNSRQQLPPQQQQHNRPPSKEFCNSSSNASRRTRPPLSGGRQLTDLNAALGRAAAEATSGAVAGGAAAGGGSRPWGFGRSEDDKLWSSSAGVGPGVSDGLMQGTEGAGLGPFGGVLNPSSSSIRPRLSDASAAGGDGVGGQGNHMEMGPPSTVLTNKQGSSKRRISDEACPMSLGTSVLKRSRAVFQSGSSTEQTSRGGGGSEGDGQPMSVEQLERKAKRASFSRSSLDSIMGGLAPDSDQQQQQQHELQDQRHQVDQHWQQQQEQHHQQQQQHDQQQGNIRGSCFEEERHLMGPPAGPVAPSSWQQSNITANGWQAAAGAAGVAGAETAGNRLVNGWQPGQQQHYQEEHNYGGGQPWHFSFANHHQQQQQQLQQRLGGEVRVEDHAEGVEVAGAGGGSAALPPFHHHHQQQQHQLGMQGLPDVHAHQSAAAGDGLEEVDADREKPYWGPEGEDGAYEAAEEGEEEEEEGFPGRLVGADSCTPGRSAAMSLDQLVELAAWRRPCLNSAEMKYLRRRKLDMDEALLQVGEGLQMGYCCMGR